VAPLGGSGGEQLLSERWQTSEVSLGAHDVNEEVTVFGHCVFVTPNMAQFFFFEP